MNGLSLLLREVPGMGDCIGDKGGLLMDAPSWQNNWKCVWEILFNYAYALEFQPSASGDDEKPFVLNSVIFLNILILFSPCWLAKCDSK